MQIKISSGYSDPLDPKLPPTSGATTRNRLPGRSSDSESASRTMPGMFEDV